MKNVQRPFHAPKNLSQNYPQQRSHSLSRSLSQNIFPLTGFCFERLSDGWFWFIAANYLTSFLSRSAEKKSCAFNVYAAHWLPFDVGVFVASCSTAMLLCHQRYALFSLFDCWLFIRVHYFPFTLIERG